MPGPKRQTFRELQELQQLAGSVIMRPLAKGWQTNRQWIDGRPTADVIASFIKPNDRLTSLERLQIYNRQYWFRILDCIGDDFPGLAAVIGDQSFNRLMRAYLTEYPSRSYTMRNLGDLLPAYLQGHPEYAGNRHALAVEIARFEWAQVIAFDGEGKPPLKIDDLLGSDPAKLRLGVQPYMTLIELHWPLDEFSVALKRREIRSDASNATEMDGGVRRRPRPRMPKPSHLFVAVHRADNSIYYKRLEREAFRLLCALRDGQSLATACETAYTEADEAAQAAAAENIQRWFTNWAALGWFCKPG